MGSGAFMKTLDDARKLSEKMVAIGNLANRKAMAVITNMDIPLGENIGNSLEVIEAIDVLNGKGPKDLLEVSIALATSMVMLCNNINEEEAKNKVLEVISNGKAFEKFKQVVKAQGGNADWIDNTNLFPSAKFQIEVKAKQSGYIEHMNTENIGKIACYLGAGREKKEDKIDYQAGLKILKKTSEFVEIGETIAILYTNKEDKIEEAKKDYLNSVKLSSNKIEEPKLIYQIIK
jgi:pyrimidine-nucleoside phosphorylase